MTTKVPHQLLGLPFIKSPFENDQQINGEFDLAEGRVKLDLSGTPRHRPIVRRLRAVFTPAGG